jgi:4-amino-4-deoxy-L-arabinose transferase-like glycosyltransferase
VPTLLAAVCLGWLALTKVLFGYVLLAGLLYFLLLSLWSGRQQHRRSWQTFLFALILCMPYLFYTYGRTTRI